MCFFTHAVVLGVGYWIGKQYSDGFSIRQLPIDPANPNTQEFVVHVEKKNPANCGGFWEKSRCCQEHSQVSGIEKKEK